MPKPYTIFQFRLRGLKCDAEDCDYHDHDVEISVSDMGRWVGSPCPKCGAPLLTIDHFIQAVNMKAQFDRVNAFLNKWVPGFILKHFAVDSGAPVKTMAVDTDEKGKIKLKELDDVA